jgi:hypothetical protein
LQHNPFARKRTSPVARLHHDQIPLALPWPWLPNLD